LVPGAEAPAITPPPVLSGAADLTDGRRETSARKRRGEPVSTSTTRRWPSSSRARRTRWRWPTGCGETTISITRRQTCSTLSPPGTGQSEGTLRAARGHSHPDRLPGRERGPERRCSLLEFQA